MLLSGLGWMFDGLDMHLYTLVALPFVAELMRLPQGDTQVSEKASFIQAAFLAGCSALQTMKLFVIEDHTYNAMQEAWTQARPLAEFGGGG